MRSIILLLAACGFASLPSTPVLADETKQAFDTLYAAKLRAAAATPDRADDVALAKDMLALADKSVSQPALVTLLCESAHDLGVRHPDGYAVAVEAMTLLAQTVEEKRPAAREKLIAVLTKQSSAGKADEREPAAQELIDLLIAMGGEKLEKVQYTEAAADFRRAMTLAQLRKSPSLDDAKAKLELALSRDRSMKRLGVLQEKLLKDATDTATAEEIVKLFVIEFDDPAAAKPYLDRAKNAQLTTLVSAAAESIDSVSKETALALGEWYQGLAASVRGEAQSIPLSRAVACFDRFLQLHESDDVARVKATELRRLAADKLAKLNPPVSPKPPAASAPASTDVGIVFDFVKQFATGKSGSPGSHYTIRKDGAKQWIHMHPLPHGENATTFTVELPKIPRGRKLLLAFTTQVNAMSQDGVRFIVVVAGKEVLSHVQKDNKPTDQSIDLTKFAGSTADITLKVHCIASQGWDDSNWGYPVIKVVK